MSGASITISLDDLADLLALAQYEEPGRRIVTAADVIEFLDVPTGDAFDVAPDDAIASFRTKGLRPSFHYSDMLGAAHTHSFTVAKMMDTDLLGRVHSSLAEAMEKGTPFKEWADSIAPMLQATRWWGREEMVDPVTGKTIMAQLGSPHRLETIFRTNMQMAYAEQHWQTIESQKDIAPYLMYDAVDDFRTRPSHAARDGVILPVEHPWWKINYPPLGYNCRCGVIQLTRAEIIAMGKHVTQKPPKIDNYEWTNPRTGKKESFPEGIDPGFDYNVGMYGVVAKLERLLAEKKTLLADVVAMGAGALVAEPAFPIPVFKEAKTVAQASREATAFLKAEGPISYATSLSGSDLVRFRHAGTKWSGQVISKRYGVASFSGLDVDTANFISQWLRFAAAEADKLGIPRLRGVTTVAGRSVGSMGDGVLAISRKNNISPMTYSVLENARKMAKRYSAWKASDGVSAEAPFNAMDYFSDKRDYLENVLWHEFGHHIHGQFMVKNEIGYMSPPLEKRLIDIFNQLPRPIVAPSRYALKNSKEFFAESYSLYKMGRSEHVPQFMIDIFRKIERGELP